MEAMRRYRAWVAVVLLLFISLGIWTAVFAETPRGVLTFAVLNIGQGDGLYIEGPTGIQIMVDSGPNDGSALRELPKVMPFGDRSLNAVIDTHPDADHMGGFVDILKRYEVGAFIESGIPKDTLTVKTLDGEVTDKKIPRYIARRGMWLDLGGGARLDVLYPDQDVSTFQNKTNDGCIVAHLIYGKTSVLLTCDATKKVEEHLLVIASSTELMSDILKVGHHGSQYSTGEPFVQEVHPNVAVISVGVHNKYGHPTQRVLDTLNNHNIKTLRTDQEGTIIFQSDGKEFVRK